MNSDHSPLIVGIDVGTTSIKAVVYEVDGRAVSQASLHTITHYPQPHWAFYRAEELWELTKQVLRQAIAPIVDRERIVSAAVTSMGEAGVPIDIEGNPTFDVIAWFDTRAQPQAVWLDRVVGKDELFAKTGLSLQPIFGLCKLLWLKDRQPHAYSRTVRWLNVADYIAFRLSGVAATDYSLASRTLALDLHRLQWDHDILRAVGILPDILPQLRPSGTSLGPITGSSAEQTFLPPTTSIAVGGHDHVCGALATGVIRPGSMLNSLGTAEAVFIPLERPIADPALGRQGYTQGAHVVPGHYYVFGGQYTSGASISWLRDLVYPDSDYADLMTEAKAAPAGSLGVCFLPHLRLANPPHDDPKARGAFIGLTADVNRGTLSRAVFEGLAFETRNSLESLRGFSEAATPEKILAIGGSTNNRLLMQIKATVLAQPLNIPDIQEATTLGAAILGGIGAGVYKDITTALASMPKRQSTAEPVASWTSKYDAIFQEIYQPLYETLRSTNHAIHRLQATNLDQDVH